MNSKLTLPDIVDAVSRASGKTKKITEDFLRELFALVSASLAEGESVKIKGIGTFKVVEVDSRRSVNVATGEEMEIPGHRKISFIPSKDIAAKVNAPFEAFESVELADGVTDEMLDEAGSADSDTPVPDLSLSVSAETEPQDSSPAEMAIAGSTPEATLTPEPDIPEPAVDSSDSSDSDPDTSEIAIAEYCLDEADRQQTATEEQQTATEEQQKEAEELQKEEIAAEPSKTEADHSHRLGLGFLLGFITALCVLVLTLAVWRGASPESFTSFMAVAPAVEKAPATEVLQPAVAEDTATEVEEDTAAAAAVEEEMPDTRPSDEPVYDTITKTRYLTTMAKEHYGNYHLWPYIYEENAKILGHPDRIRPGTRVVIPSLSKYGVDPNKASDIAAAKRKGAEIYARYNKRGK